MNAIRLSRLLSFQTLGFIFLFSACVSTGPTKPNEPFGGNPYPAELNELVLKNEVLVKELGKLPELQDGISEVQSVALSKLVVLYKANTAAFDKAIEQMYQVGIPEVRKYCSPLQALFWMVLDNKDIYLHDQVTNYNLKKLLKLAWSDPKKDKIYKIVERCNDKQMKKSLITALEDGTYKRMGSDWFYYFFENNPTKFKYISNPEENNAIKKTYKLRWGNFNTVADRLNDPVLIDYFIDMNFKYSRGKFVEAAYTFHSKFGNCTSVAIFGEKLLRLNGYNTFILNSWWGPSQYYDWHTVSGIILPNGKYWVTIDFNGTNKLHSINYTDALEFEKKRYGKKIKERKWGKHMQPWN